MIDLVQLKGPMASKDPAASHTLVLLSDGLDGKPISEYKPVLAKLAVAKTRLFTIGIGHGHDPSILKGIVGVDQKNPPIKWEYIDATRCGDAIERAIKEIYEAAIASFNGLEITSRHLAAGYLVCRWGSEHCKRECNRVRFG